MWSWCHHILTCPVNDLGSKNERPQRLGVDRFNLQGLKGVLLISVEVCPVQEDSLNKTILRIYYTLGILLTTFHILLYVELRPTS